MSQNLGYNRNLRAASAGFGSAFSAAANNSAEPAQEQTLLQKIGIQVNTPKVDAGALKRDASNPQTVTDLQGAQQTAAACTQDVGTVRAVAEKSHEQAVGFAVALSKQVAADNPALGIRPNQIDTTFGRSCATSEVVSAAAGKGLGSMVSHVLDGVSALGDLQDDSSRLNPEQAKSLADEVASRIKGESSPIQNQTIGASFQETRGADFSQASFDLSECTGDDLIELMSTDFEDLPEIVELDATLDALDEVHANHDVIAAAQEKGVNEPIGAFAVDCASDSTEALVAQASIIQGQSFIAQVPANMASLFIDTQEPPPAYNNEAGLAKLAVDAANWGSSPAISMRA